MSDTDPENIIERAARLIADTEGDEFLAALSDEDDEQPDAQPDDDDDGAGGISGDPATAPMPVEDDGQ